MNKCGSWDTFFPAGRYTYIFSMTSHSFSFFFSMTSWRRDCRFDALFDEKKSTENSKRTADVE